MKKLNTSPKVREILTDALYLLASGVLFAIAYNMFLVPGQIFIGGAGGIATALNVLFGLPTGLMITLINVPLVLLFMLFYGMKSTIKGIVGILVSSTFVDVSAVLIPFEELFPAAATNQLLCGLLGGLSLGAAVAFMFARGYSTGGSDLAAFIVKVFIPNTPTPKVIFAIDACVVVFASFLKTYGLNGYKITVADISVILMSVFFSIITTFMSNISLSTINGGFDKTRMAYIFSDHYDVVADAIMEQLSRGVTILDGKGWYTKEDKKVILCVVKKNEIFLLKSLVRKMDESAFMILSEATETIGRGFKAGVGDVSIEPKKKK